MSEENVEIGLQAFRYFEAEDMDGLVGLWDPNIHMTALEDWPEQGPFDGIEAARRQYERLAAEWSDHRFQDIEVVAEEGDWVVYTFGWYTRGANSGIDVDFNVAMALRAEDGKVAELHYRWKAEDALKAAGLSE